MTHLVGHRAVDVVAFFAKRGHPGNARRIVAPLLGGEQREVRLEYPVTNEIPAEHPDYQSKIACLTLGGHGAAPCSTLRSDVRS